MKRGLNIWQRLCSLVMVIVMLLTALPATTAAAETPSKMIRIERIAHSNDHPMVQKITLTQGKTYTVSMQAKHNGTNVWFVVKRANSGAPYCDGSPYVEENLTTSNKNFDCNASNGTYTYSFTWNNPTGQYSVGISFRDSASPITMYLAGMKMVEEGSDVNLFTENCLDGWYSDWTVAQEGATTFMNAGAIERAQFVAYLENYDASVFKMSYSPKMMRIDRVAHADDHPLIQKLTLTQGKQYSVSFQLKTSATNVWFVVKPTNSQAPHTGGTPLIEENLSADNKDLTFEASTSTWTYSFTWNNPTKEYAVGITFRESDAAAVVLFGKMRMVEGTGTENMFTENTFYGWYSDWTIGGDNTTTFMNGGSLQTAKYVCTLMEYDAAAFAPGVQIPGENGFGAGEEEKPTGPITPEKTTIPKLPNPTKYIHLDGKQAENVPALGQDVTLEKGKTYTVAFRLKYTGVVVFAIKDAFSKQTFKQYAAYNLADNSVFSYDSTTYTYAFTFTWNNDTAVCGIGFAPMLDRGPVTMELAAMTLFESGKTVNNNLFTVNTLEKWRSDWNEAAAGDVTLTDVKTAANASYTATLKDFDAKLFEGEKEGVVGQSNMIYIKTTGEDFGAAPAFGQNLKLTNGQTYTIAFNYKYKSGGLNTSFFLRIKAALGSGTHTTYVGSNTGDFKVENDREKCFATYTFKWTKATGTYSVCFNFTGPTEMYIGNFTLYNVNAPELNLCPYAKYPGTLNGWRADWKAADEGVKTFTQKEYTATISGYDANIFVPDPVLPNQMVYIENNGTHRQWVQRLQLEPGVKYRFSMCVSCAVPPKGMVMHTGQRVTIFNNIDPINEPDYNADWYELVFEFTLPETHKGVPVEFAQIFVGIQFMPGTIGYVFDPKIWEVDDPKQQNLFENPDYNRGMDNWALSWGAWFIPAMDGLGVMEKEKEGEWKLQVMPLDESKFVSYTDDSRFDDGQWWKPEDVVAEIETSSTICGTLCWENGTPIEGFELVLVSDKDTFRVETDASGAFSFDSIPAGFYELCYLNDGEQLRTGFATTIKDGYTIIVDLSYR